MDAPLEYGKNVPKFHKYAKEQLTQAIKAARDEIDEAHDKINGLRGEIRTVQDVMRDIERAILTLKEPAKAEKEAALRSQITEKKLLIAGMEIQITENKLQTTETEAQIAKWKNAIKISSMLDENVGILLNSMFSSRRSTAAFKISEYLCTHLDKFDAIGKAGNQNGNANPRNVVEQALARALALSTLIWNQEYEYAMIRALERIQIQNFPIEFFNAKEEDNSSNRMLSFRARSMARAIGAGVIEPSGTKLSFFLQHVSSSDPSLATAARELLLAKPESSIELVYTQVNDQVRMCERGCGPATADSISHFSSLIRVLESINSDKKGVGELLTKAKIELENRRGPMIERRKLEMLEGSRKSLDARLDKFTRGRYAKLIKAEQTAKAQAIAK